MKKMRKALLLIMLLTLVTLLSAESMLYEVKGTHNKVYILGSIHLMPESAYPLDKAIDEAFDASDVLVVELDASQIDQAEMQQFIGANAFLPEGTLLSNMIKPKEFRSLTEKFETMGIPQATMNKFRPWFATLSLSMGILQKLGLKAEVGVDMVYLAKAHLKNMQIIELETMMSQLKMLSSLPDSVQVDYLNYSLEDYDEIESVFCELLKAWKTGDAKKLDELSKGKMKELSKDLPGIMAYYDKLFTERDGEMTDKIIKFANNKEKHTYFVIVGSFHLVGDDGIIKRLNDKGIKTIQR